MVPSNPLLARRRLAVIVLSVFLLLAVVASFTVITHNQKESKKLEVMSTQSSVKDLSFPQLSKMAKWGDFDPVKVYRWAVEIALREVNRTSVRLEEFRRSGNLEPRVVDALGTCHELLDLSYDMLNDSLVSTDLSVASVVEDFRTWLSASITYQETCLEAFKESNPDLREKIKYFLADATNLSSQGLAILTRISDALSSTKHRRLLAETQNSDDEFPSWFPGSVQSLLAAWDLRSKADIVVATDGSGKYTSINEALKDVPEKSTTRTVIYVKKGVYKEKVKVEMKKWNVWIIGDGQEVTTITGSLNAIDGVQTFDTASFAVFGKGFVGMNLGFMNTAGPEKHQAVAMMASADHVVFYKCRFSANQDTLYAHALRQFYRECDIIGTVDIIFGNAATVLQRCRIFPRRGREGSPDSITAQSKSDKNQNTGISIHDCNISAYDNLSGVDVYLGRPWQKYATVVYMKSYLSGIIHPNGWLPWADEKPASTIFYAEFENSGPGASTKKRVGWKGLRSISLKEALKFTVGQFIGGESWIPGTGVPFDKGY